MPNSRIDELFQPLTTPERRPRDGVRSGAELRTFMRFSCDSCGAQYMISDDKVGAGGVKVRCKKCSHIILVKPAAADAANASEGKNAQPETAEKGLDAELGQAFDAMLGDGSSGEESEKTQLISHEELARGLDAPGKNEVRPTGSAPAAGSAAPLATEWYVAIRDTQVGPLAPAAVKQRWESGEIGPDTLVWRAGMADWKPLSTASDLASFLAPVPRPTPPRSAAAEPSAAPAARTAAPAARESAWKPDAASALASLAHEEMAALAPTEPEVPRPNGAGSSLVDTMNLPDAGGVDPTGAVPLPIKGLEPTHERDLKRRSGVARDSAEVRLRRNTTRTLIGIAIGLTIVFGAAIAGVVVFFDKKLAEPTRGASAVAVRPPATPAAPPPATAAPPQQPAPAPQVAAPAPAPVAVAPAPPATRSPPATVSPASGPAPQVAAAPPRAPNPPEPAPARPTRHEAPSKAVAKRHTRATAEARPEPRPEAPPARSDRIAKADATPPAAAPARRKTGDPLLDFDSNTSEGDLERELGATPARKRDVYVPPAPGGDLAERVTDSQITEGVAGKIAALRQCMDQQKAADPDVKGTLKLRWIISGDGGVRDVRCLTDEYARQPIAQCLAGVVKTIRFPRSRTTGQEVVFPFKF